MTLHARRGVAITVLPQKPTGSNPDGPYWVWAKRTPIWWDAEKAEILPENQSDEFVAALVAGDNATLLRLRRERR